MVLGFLSNEFYLFYFWKAFVVNMYLNLLQKFYYLVDSLQLTPYV